MLLRTQDFSPASVSPPYVAPEHGSEEHLILVLERLVTGFGNRYGLASDYRRPVDILFFWETVQDCLEDYTDHKRRTYEVH